MLQRIFTCLLLISTLACFGKDTLIINQSNTLENSQPFQIEVKRSDFEKSDGFSVAEKVGIATVFIQIIGFIITRWNTKTQLNSTYQNLIATSTIERKNKIIEYTTSLIKVVEKLSPEELSKLRSGLDPNEGFTENIIKLKIILGKTNTEKSLKLKLIEYKTNADLNIQDWKKNILELTSQIILN